LRACKKLHFAKAINSNSNNLKKIWSILNHALNTPKSSNNINALMINDSLITDPVVIANQFNNFFTNVASDIASKIHPTSPPSHNNLTPVIDADAPKFDLSSNPITDEEIISCIRSLEDKRTPDMSGISSNIIKKIYPSIIRPLKHVFSKSLTSGIVPSKFKIAKVIPLFKSGNCLDMSNYRPISLLSSFSKILEKIVHTRLYSYLSANSLISPNQFGFRPNHSTSHPMTLLINKLSSAINSKKHSIVVFCDLRKAFDTCNHKILLKKLSALGVVGSGLRWFENYLSGRKQYVSCGDSDSSLLSILIGVPQGSILGPLLFLVYINDLPGSTDLFSLLFADDTALTACADNLADLYSSINAELRKLCTFFRENKLSLNPEKTNYLLFTHNNSSPPPELHLVLNNNNPNENDPSHISVLSRVLTTDKTPAIKYLGVYFDSNLNFKFHINQISKKLSRALFALRRVKNILPPRSLKTLYYSLFHCHLTYGIEIWSSVSPSLLKPLITKQKAAIRVISLQSHNAHTEPLFKSLSILPLPKLVEQFKLKFIHSCIYNLAPTALLNTWPTSNEHRQIINQNIPGHNLRNNDDLYIPHSRLKSLSHFPLYSFPILWNGLPEYLKSIPSKSLFSSNLKNHFLSSLTDVPVCNRLFCPSCSAVVRAPRAEEDDN
jgi:Reverse transcriptase (RNA-dependent DNA polymerase)